MLRAGHKSDGVSFRTGRLSIVSQGGSRIDDAIPSSFYRSDGAMFFFS